MKKIIALACALVMLVSMFTISASAAIDGYSVKLDFVGYEVKGSTKFAVVDVNMTVADTLTPYTMTPADWETTFEDSYTGFALQGMTIEIPKVDGLTYVGSLSTINEPVALTEGATTYKLAYANTGDYSTYYAGNLNKTIAKLYFRITGDVEGIYNVNANYAMVKYFSWTGGKTATPILHETGDFTLEGAVVKPAEPEKEPTVNTIAATEDIEVAGTKYLGTAVYEASFDLANVIDTEKDYGIKVDGEKFEIAIGGNGGVDVVLAFYGITGDAPVVQSFWTAK